MCVFIYFSKKSVILFFKNIILLNIGKYYFTTSNIFQDKWNLCLMIQQLWLIEISDQICLYR